uniref:NADH dehydrogenase subunit 4L n=1 Tax=Cyphoderus aff. similis TaxID=2901280 RepID=UPI001EE0DA4F|nr:NADH dehydrogenase subunit 4L [Cyphoderus aff. similis]UIR97921.1 NADH dehydrogenase subunit 4L [Cyphoderus aff. similis]
MVVIFSFFSGMLVFSSVREHLLSMLLSLEYMVLMIYLLMFTCLDTGSYYFSFIYLVMTACEGALGLSILITMGRAYGGDYFSSLSMIN